MIIDRIFQIIDYKGINKTNFYKEVGLSNGFLDKVKDVGASKLDLILNKYPEINPEWLLTGKGEMLKGEVRSTPAKNINKGIPLLPFEVFAGVGFDVEGVNFDVIEERYEIPLFEGIKVDFMLPVRGSSMYPKYSSGDVVACRLIKEITFFNGTKCML